ncbi:MAG: methyltransferase type 11 [Acidobacteriota bacterium]
MKKSYVQYGCGFSAPAEWRNFDASPTLRFERLHFVGKLYRKNGNRFPTNVEYGDIIKGLPVPLGSCAGMYASHILEHLALTDFRLALENTYSLLSLGGIFRLIVPDLEKIAGRYLHSEDPAAAERFMREACLGVETRRRGVKSHFQSVLGNSAHLWMWDFRSLSRELTTAGFVNVRRCEFGDSSDPMFTLVEDAERFVDAVAVECRKA